jgi:hypothetical protein
MAVAAFIVPPTILLSACSDESADVEPTGGAGASDDGEGICLLNNCSADEHCVGCPDGRDICLVEENRCIACDPSTGEGCADGEYCTEFGICAPDGQTCPTDGDGNPTVTCSKNSDCLACSPQHQVCDTATQKCQECTANNTQHCNQSDICVDTNDDMHPDSCSPKCPATCDADNDCSTCGSPGKEAHACFAHKCAECSDTFPCKAGEECIQGVCVPPCGIPGPVAGTCEDDGDCAYCGAPNNVANPWNCKYPVNGGTHGTCTPPATGCSDLGNGVAVLPPPYSDFTQACSNDNDCAGAGIQFNVGQAIRDLVGDDELDLGFHQIKINDANVNYAMPKCASIELTETISCGICVPCKVDSDCQPIAIDQLVVDLFKNDPFALIGGALLMDLLWGDNDDHNLNFFCQPVAAGYGACIPCGNPLAPCGSGGGGGSGGTCDHGVNEVGGPLTDSCSPCAATVCGADPFCCGASSGTWDQLCVNQAAQMCASCAHDECTQGDALDPSCNSCVGSVCAADPFCCNTQSGGWDNLCVSQAADTGTHPACSSACSGGCVHSECSTGGALSSSCSTCATDVCAMDPYCCNNDWDSQCVSEAQQVSSCGC